MARVRKETVGAMSRGYAVQSLMFGLILIILFLFSQAGVDAAIPEMVLRQQGAVVMIEVAEVGGKRVSQGTGFIIEPSGLIVTNYHVVSKWFEQTNMTGRVKLDNGAFFNLEGIVAIDRPNDIALIKVKGRNLPAVSINRHIRARQGEDVYVIGSPLGLESTVSQGIVSNIRDGGIIQITAAISPGSSGSPVYNARAEVIGVATSQTKIGQNLNFAMPIGKALALADAKRDGALLARPAPGSGPARAVPSDWTGMYRNYFKFIIDENYAEAWNALTAESKYTIAGTIAKKAAVPPENILLKLNGNEDNIRDRYFSAFRKNAGQFLADAYARGRYTVRQVGADSVTLTIEVRNDPKDFRILRQNGAWKINFFADLFVKQYR